MTVRRREPPHYKRDRQGPRVSIPPFIFSELLISPSSKSSSSSLCPRRKPPLSAKARVMVGRGRQKIEVKLIEKKAARLACFSKRRVGLFKKARELSVLCGATVAALAFSPAGKPMPFDVPALESLIDLKCPVSPELPPLVKAAAEASPSGDWESEFREAMDGKLAHFWWERADVQSMELEELLRFERSILYYREKRKKYFDDLQEQRLRGERLLMDPIACSVGSSSSADPIFDDLMLGEDQRNIDDWMMNTIEEFEEWLMDGHLEPADPCATFFQQQQQPPSSASDAQILQLQQPAALEESSTTTIIVDDSAELLPMPTHLLPSFVEDGYISIWDF